MKELYCDKDPLLIEQEIVALHPAGGILGCAIHCQHMKTIQTLIQERKGIIFGTPTDERIPLSLALKMESKSKTAPISRLLLTHIMSTKDVSLIEDAASYIACLGGNDPHADIFKEIRLFISLGYHPRRNIRSLYFYDVCRQGDVQLLEAMLYDRKMFFDAEGKVKSDSDMDINQGFYWAAMSKNYEVAKRLYKEGPLASTCRWVLSLAIRSDEMEIIDILSNLYANNPRFLQEMDSVDKFFFGFEEKFCEPTKLDFAGREINGLLYACRVLDVITVKKFLHLGADITYRNFSAIHIATYEQQRELLEDWVAYNFFTPDYHPSASQCEFTMTERLKTRKNLFHVFDMKNLDHRDKVLNLYSSGIDLSEQEDFSLHIDSIKLFLQTLDESLHFQLPKELVRVIVSYFWVSK